MPSRTDISYSSLFKEEIEFLVKESALSSEEITFFLTSILTRARSHTLSEVKLEIARAVQIAKVGGLNSESLQGLSTALILVNLLD